MSFTIKTRVIWSDAKTGVLEQENEISNIERSDRICVAIRWPELSST